MIQVSSLEAHDRIRSTKHTVLKRVEDYLRSRGRQGATDVEIQQALWLPVTTEVPRRNELVKAGIVRNTGKRRKTGTGASAIVWAIVETPGGQGMLF